LALDNYFTVGVIAGPHGLRGEVRVLPRTDFPERRFAKGSVLHTRPSIGSEGSLTIVSSRPHKQFWLVAFKGFEDINTVEKWKGTELCVSEDELMPLPSGTYYIHQLVGLRVRTDDGREVGVLTDVLKPGANDVYVVHGSLQQRDVLIPAIPECVLNVSMENGEMTVHLMQGLLESDDSADTNADADGGDDNGNLNTGSARDNA